MINFSETIIDKIVIHRIGNRNENEGIEYSQAPIEITDEHTLSILLTFFLSPFKSPEEYQFDLQQPNLEKSVMEYASKIFDTPQEFYNQSVNIAEKLYYVSNNEKILQGELYVVHFRDCEYEEQMVNAVGIYKSEQKDTFLKIVQHETGFGIEHSIGINIKKISKACLIFNTQRDTGSVIKVYDKAIDLPYWTEDFLAVKPIENNFFNTHSFLQICKNFTDNVLTEKNNVEKNEQLGFMNKSYQYFKNNDYFDEVDFKQTVIENPDIIESFSEFKHNFEETYDVKPQSEFEISQDAVKKSKKYVRGIIKLDKNFHIYVHSKPENIEKGYDNARKLNFYKVYFETES